MPRRPTRAAGARVTRRQPDEGERRDLLFAWTVVKHVKSNAIVLARDGATIGIGIGQTSRVDAVRAGRPTRPGRPRLRPCVVASDAFFPFADGLSLALAAGATAAIQPGGSLRDQAVIAAADAADARHAAHRDDAISGIERHRARQQGGHPGAEATGWSDLGEAVPGRGSCPRMSLSESPSSPRSSPSMSTWPKNCRPALGGRFGLAGRRRLHEHQLRPEGGVEIVRRRSVPALQRAGDELPERREILEAGLDSGRSGAPPCSARRRSARPCSDPLSGDEAQQLGDLELAALGRARIALGDRLGPAPWS